MSGRRTAFYVSDILCFWTALQGQCGASFRNATVGQLRGRVRHLKLTPPTSREKVYESSPRVCYWQTCREVRRSSRFFRPVFFLSRAAELAKIQNMTAFIRSVATLLVSLFVASLPAIETPSQDGSVSLFNGRDLTGWGYGGGDNFDGKVEASDGRYSVSEGILVVNPRKEGTPPLRQLWTTKEFPNDFELRLEFRAAVDADSGIFLRKPQLQCRDYLVAGPYKELKNYKPQDWNEIVVIVKGGVAHCTCNGEVLEAALKLPATGPIGLEADRGQMEYRKIRIKEL